MTTHNFRESYGRGAKGEAFLDQFFAPRFDITDPNRQRQGVDRLFTPKDGKAPFTVEYKTDYTAVRTHNAFVETVSVDRENKPGWALASQADWLLYYLPEPEQLIYALRFEDVREQVPAWQSTYPQRSIPNHGAGGDYNTVGVLVPQEEFERVARHVIDASEGVPA